MASQATVMIEDAELVFRNFSGKEGRFNREDQKTFCVFIDDPDLVEQLVTDGWNLKYTNVREEGDEPRAYLPVEVKYENKPPNVVMITSGGRTHLDNDSIEVLDWSEFKTVDLIVNPYDWQMPNGDTGRKAYLKSMFVTIDEDELERKYASKKAAKVEE
jgi:hypothetical protein